MADTPRLEIADIPADGAEVHDDELSGLVGGKPSNGGHVSATYGGLNGDGYCDSDAGF
jgi:hypothetical protein